MLGILWRVTLFFVVFGLMGALFIVPFASVLSAWRDMFPIRVQMYGDVTVAVAMLASTWIMTRFVDGRPFLTIGFAPSQAPRDLAAGLAVGAVWLAMSVGAAWLAGWASPRFPVTGSSSQLLGTLTALLFNILTQQLLLCGYIFQTIRARTSFTVALLVSAALFSALHAGAFHGTWLPFVNVFGAGALFCLAYGITGNLWFPIGIHFAWNSLLGPVLGLTVSGSDQLSIGWRVFQVEGPALFTGGAFGLEGGLVVTITTAAALAGMGAFFRSQLR
ncbi:MAG TPA: type II CAAX endopeptidase family protein [Thermoanaerobaculia bacterium]|nr:type II CAAX endopeptidase family protein [Thermoanaerobaculia bacterium]